MLCYVLADVLEGSVVTPVVAGRAQRFTAGWEQRTRHGEQKWDAFWLRVEWSEVLRWWVVRNG